MAHHLEELVKKISVVNYKNILTNTFGDEDLNNLQNYTGLNNPFKTPEELKTYWDPILKNAGYDVKSYVGSWINIMRPGQEQDTHLHTDYGFDVNEETTTYTAIVFLKFNPEVHKPTYFCDNPSKAYEYKPADVQEGDCLIFPANLYHRAPLNTSDENRIVMVCVFNINK